MIGIRHEDKSAWEGRTPLVPDDLRQLRREHGIEFYIEDSPIRAFSADAYREAGAIVTKDLGPCPVILGVKEIPVGKLAPGKTYVYFSHTIKAQPANMPALRRIMELGGTLIDYERITDEAGQRLVFFGQYAGLAGMIDTLWAFGQRLAHEGLASPLARVRPAHEYKDLADAQRALAEVADDIRRHGLPPVITPLVCGFAGYGRVSQGAQQVYDLLPVREVTPSELADVPADAHTCYKAVFREEHLVRHRDAGAPFVLREYYDHPERYEAAFLPHAEHLSILVNCIYWEPKYPHLLTRAQLQSLYEPGPPRLRVIGDITCDIDGSLACTTRATTPDSPVYVYDPRTHTTQDGVAGPGPVVLAVDFLPCELPVDASRYFSGALRPFIPALAQADWSKPLAESGLPPVLQRATIVYQGQLTVPYRYLEPHVR